MNLVTIRTRDCTAVGTSFGKMTIRDIILSIMSFICDAANGVYLNYFHLKKKNYRPSKKQINYYSQRPPIHCHSILFSLQYLWSYTTHYPPYIYTYIPKNSNEASKACDPLSSTTTNFCITLTCPYLSSNIFSGLKLRYTILFL